MKTDEKDPHIDSKHEEKINVLMDALEADGACHLFCIKDDADAFWTRGSMCRTHTVTLICLLMDSLDLMSIEDLISYVKMVRQKLLQNN